MPYVDASGEFPANHATDLTLRSYADTEFVRWVDWAQAFVAQMEFAGLTPEQKSVVKRVLNMEEVG